MTNFETRLKESLTAEDEAFLTDLESGESLFGQLGATFSGPMKVWTGFAFVLSFAFFGIAVWAGFRMYATSEPRELVFWLAVFIFGMLAVSMLKIWFWMRMNHLAVLRELKRIELRIVRGAP
ncbi:MAG: DUF6768 family protein [Hyphomonas sp.]